MAILVANTKLENSDFAWYEFYVDNVADIDSLPTRTWDANYCLNQACIVVLHLCNMLYSSDEHTF